jgi:hypothetical protein
VARLFIALIWLLALALSPVAANAAASGQQSVMDCGMQQNMPGKPMHHGKMDCCTPACQANSAAALLQERRSAADDVASGNEPHANAPMRKLASFAVSSLDPPPRLLS